MNLGNSYFKLGGKENLNLAIESYKKAIELDSSDHKVYVSLGISYSQLEGKENQKLAMESYKRAVELNPESPDAYTGLCEIYILNKAFDKAFENILKSYNLDKENLKQMNLKLSEFKEFIAFLNKVEMNEEVKGIIKELKEMEKNLKK